jgi:hypothetical protein
MQDDNNGADLKNITSVVKINMEEQYSIKEYCEINNIDYNALNNIAKSGKVNGNSKSKQYKTIEALVNIGAVPKEYLDKIKESNSKREQELKNRKKIVSRIKIKFKMKLVEYFKKNKDYFDRNEIKIEDINNFITGKTTGTRKGSKAYFIRELFSKDELL